MSAANTEPALAANRGEEGSEPSPAGGTARPPAPLHVYVHFPWCLRKCPYCDFLSVPGDPADIPHRRYADAVLAELERRAETLAARPLGSIFIGGGTPSLWDPAELARVVTTLQDTFRGPDVEISAEGNPSSLFEPQLLNLRDAGVNRLSIGVQSLDARRLDFLGRWHSPFEGQAAIEAALAAGFARVSADLIQGRSWTASERRRRRGRSNRRQRHLAPFSLFVDHRTGHSVWNTRSRRPFAAFE